jgi:hypothetical protein
MSDAAADPRRARPITVRVRGVANKREATLWIDGQRWAVVEWGGPGRWCIEDDQSRCLEHVEDLRGEAATLKAAIALAETMIRDGTMPSPEEAKRLAEKRETKRSQDQDAWDHPERLYEPLADALEMWRDREDLARSNSYRRLQDELIALATGAVDHFEQVRGSALRALRHIELNDRWSHWYRDDTAAREQLAYAEEHLERARQIIRTHAPDRAALLPPPDTISAEQVIEQARAERIAQDNRRQRGADRDPDGSRRARRLAMGRWRRNIGYVEYQAALMTDAEARWFAGLKDAPKTAEAALRLDALHKALSERSLKQQSAQMRADDRANAERLQRLGGGAA